MAKSTQHVQAILHRDQSVMVAWIPRHCAVVGKVVDLDDPENGEAKGWTVAEAFFGTIQDSKWIGERTRDHLNMKKMTDI